MKIIVVGPTLLTRHCVEALISKTSHKIIVFTLEDSLAYKKSRFAIMDDLSAEGKITLFKVSDINSSHVVRQIQELKPDIMFELGWSQIIAPEILRIPKLGCVGVHASLLPKNRGAASLNWAIINNEKKTGVSLFYLAEKPDDGDIIAQKEFDIDYRDTIATLHSKSDLASSDLLIENIDSIEAGTAARVKQDPAHVTYTKKRKPEDGVINWEKSTMELYNWIRAQTHPFPGAFTFHNGRKMHIWESAESKITEGSPGEVLGIKRKEGILVSASNGSILIKRAQMDGEAEMWADDLAEKYDIKKGDLFG